MKTKNSDNVKNSDLIVIKSQNSTGSNIKQEFMEDVLSGLSGPKKSLPCKYIYDERGSLLFQKITDLPEYYLTRCEREILKTFGKKIISRINRPTLNLVELGAGNGEKTRILLKELIRMGSDFTLFLIDISSSAIKDLTENLREQIPEIHVRGFVSDYFDGIKWLSDLKHGTNFILFLGSNIGNFEPGENDVFLSSMWNVCNDGDYLLIGFDLRKDLNLLMDAYNDSRGITAQFNLNLLERINNELDGNFDLSGFKYFSTYEPVSGAIKSYLVSQKKQTVKVKELNREFSFESGEFIHTESSYKFKVEDIDFMAKKNGFIVVENFFDSRGFFVDSLWQVSKK